MENITLKQKISNVIRRYGYYMLLGTFLLAVLITLIIVGVTANSINEETLPTNTAVVTPCVPVLNATIYKEFYGDELMYNQTLKQWETHNGIDLQVANGSKVYSMLDGKITNIYSNVLEGTVIEIDHGDGLVSTYGSLSEDVNVKIGDSIQRGSEIGVVAESASAESDAGSHLHFSIMDNGKKVDPAAYLNISTK